jgi:hypothetical protein
VLAGGIVRARGRGWLVGFYNTLALPPDVCKFLVSGASSTVVSRSGQPKEKVAELGDNGTQSARRCWHHHAAEAGELPA